MTKKILCSVCVLAFALSFCVPSFAVATSVNSPMSEPVANIEGLTYTEYAIIQLQSGTTYLYELILNFDSSPTSIDFCTFGWYGGFCCRADVSFTYYYNKYDVSTGSLIETDSVSTAGTGSGPSAGLYWTDKYRQAIWMTTWDDPCEYIYFIITDGATISYFTVSDPFVLWGAVVPEQSIFRSHLPEPVCDEYNKYFVMYNEDNARLYWFNIRELSYTLTAQSETEYPIVDGNIADLQISFAEDDSIQALIAFNYDLFQLPPATEIFCDYQIQASCFELLNGTLISSVLISDSGTFTDNIPLSLPDFFFEDPASVSSYGIAFSNESTMLIHLACIVWGVDPVVDSWRENTTSLLNQILQALQGSSTEVTTVSTPDFFGQIEEAQGQLTITNADGESPHGGGGRDFFDNADSGIENIATPLSFVREFYDTYIKDEPILYLPLIVALALGVAITILGKDKSD